MSLFVRVCSFDNNSIYNYYQSILFIPYPVPVPVPSFITLALLYIQTCKLVLNFDNTRSLRSLYTPRDDFIVFRFGYLNRQCRHHTSTPRRFCTSESGSQLWISCPTAAAGSTSTTNRGLGSFNRLSLKRLFISAV